MWVSKRLDLTWGDVAAAATRCFASGRPEEGAARAEALWSGDGEALACLSVRSGFDLLLEALALPAGTEVVFSAMTVADMPRIARDHGLVVVPCDLASGGAAPGVAELERACTPKTRVVVLAHLFGSRMDVAPLVTFTHERRILIVEDCAQAYVGARYRGHPDSDVTFFSFGPIKHATALGGALALVRDGPLLARMRDLHRRWPVQPRTEYLRRVLKYAVLHGLSARPVYGPLSRAARVMGLDVDALVNRLTRGFPGQDFFRRIRRRPSAPLLRTLVRRLAQDVSRFQRHETRVRDFLTRAGVEGLCPGAGRVPHTFWLVPILTSDPRGVAGALRRHGFDATLGRSFVVIGEGSGASPGAERVHRHAVYLPLYPAMPDGEVRRLAEVLRRTVEEPMASI